MQPKTASTENQETFNHELIHHILAREAIFDRNLILFGYCLTFKSRSIEEYEKLAIENQGAGYKLFPDCLDDPAIQTLVNNSKIFIEGSHEMLSALEKITPTINVDWTLSVPSSSLNDSSKDALSSLYNHKYSLALHQVDKIHNIAPFIQYIKYLIIDLRFANSNNKSYLTDILTNIKSEIKSNNIKVIAMHVDTFDQFNEIEDLDIDYFHGDFIATPSHRKTIHKAVQKESANKIVIARILALINSENYTIKELETLISQEPKITLKLFKYANSASFIKASNIQSIQQVLVYMGEETLKKCINSIALSTIDDKPKELIIITMTRAKMCELLMDNPKDKEVAFTTGLLSTMDAIFDEDLPTIINKIEISENVKQALLTKEGHIGEILKKVIDYETTNWLDPNHNKELESLNEPYLLSLLWAKESLQV